MKVSCSGLLRPLDRYHIEIVLYLYDCICTLHKRQNTQYFRFDKPIPTAPIAQCNHSVSLCVKGTSPKHKLLSSILCTRHSQYTLIAASYRVNTEIFWRIILKYLDYFGYVGQFLVQFCIPLYVESIYFVQTAVQIFPLNLLVDFGICFLFIVMNSVRFILLWFPLTSLDITWLVVFEKVTPQSSLPCTISFCRTVSRIFVSCMRMRVVSLRYKLFGWSLIVAFCCMSLDVTVDWNNNQNIDRSWNIRIILL